MENRQVSKQQLLLLLLGLDGSGVISSKGVGGITRLQKLLFLLWKEAGIEDVGAKFEFKPYKAGPYSRKLYDELELLENLGLIKSEVQGEAAEAEAIEIEELSFEHLMGSAAAPFQHSSGRADAITSDTFSEKRYTVTDQGKELLIKLNADPELKPFVEGIRKIKTKFANISLQDLLYHVYTKYDKDGWTSESEIRDKVLRKGRSH